jgi:hypothetical protein
MSDYEIDEIRRIRRQVSAENDRDLRKVAEYYRRVEQELRASRRFRFAGEPEREPEASR